MEMDLISDAGSSTGPKPDVGRRDENVYGITPLTVTVATARKISGLGNTTIYALIKARKLKTVHVGRRTLITFRSLEALLAPPAFAPGAPPRKQKNG